MDLLGFLFGSGGAKNASEDLRLRKRYNDALVEAQMKGETLPPYEEWAKQFGKNNAGQPYKRN